MTHSTEEMKEALKGMAKICVSIAITSVVTHKPIPGDLKESIEKFIDILPEINNILDTMDTQLEIENKDDNGGSSS